MKSINKRVDKEMINKIKQKLTPLFKSYKVKKAAFFGSYIKGKNTFCSDIDILVELDASLSLIDFIRLKQKAEKKLGKRVDLVEYETIKPALKDKILKEQVTFL
ncbi:MAG: nucleotidyltransferase family protein [Candidatus Omnitrophica bacterium]|nr:nucleotidyltransferase family protein [Candidatus Omnitrophota bacterium]